MPGRYPMTTHHGGRAMHLHPSIIQPTSRKKGKKNVPAQITAPYQNERHSITDEALRLFTFELSAKAVNNRIVSPEPPPESS
jgi:hypothetical protein